MFLGNRVIGGEFKTSVCARNEINSRDTLGDSGFSTYPGYLSVQEPMEHALVRQDRVAGDAIEERLEHSFPPSDQGGILLGFGLFDCVIADRILRRYGWDYEGGIELDEVSPEGLELRVAMTGFMVLIVGVSGCFRWSREGGHVHLL